MKVILYDFDGTIYNGDSTIDFYIFCLISKKCLIRYLPIQLLYYLLYILKIVEKKKFKEKFFVFLKGISDINYLITAFWEVNRKKINTWYIDKTHESDIILSASPEFLLTPIAKEFGVKKLICTIVNESDGAFLSENCYGEEKVRRLVELYQDISVEETYTDSFSDYPILNLAKKKFIVKNGIIKEL